jgi:PAS domain S-box-containing protein
LKLRTRVIVVVVTTTLCLCAILFAILSVVFSRNYSQIENDRMQQNLNRIQFALDNEEIALSQISTGWSTWDDTYQFVEDGNPEYVQNNFVDGAFTGPELNIIAIINNSGQIVYAGNFDMEKQQQIPLSAETRRALTNDFLLSRSVEKGKIGILPTDEGPLLIGTNPILTSKGEGPVHGTVIMGRFIDRNLLRKLSFITKLTITTNTLTEIESNNNSGGIPPLTAKNPISIQPVNSNTLTGSYLIPDIHGKPYLVVSTQTTRDVFSQARVTFLWLLCGFTIVAVSIIIVNILFLDRLILKRLRVLSNFAAGISRQVSFSGRVSLDGKDELTALGNEINAMLSSLSTVNNQLTESENKYSTLVESSSDGIILITNKVVTYANPRLLQMIGLTREEYLGKTYGSSVIPENRDWVTTQFNNRLSGKPAEDSYESAIMHKSGRRIPVEVSAKVIKLNQQDCMMIVLRDITERKEAEKELDRLFQKEKTLRQDLEEEARTRSQFISVLAHELRNPLTPVLASLEMLRDSLVSEPNRLQYKLTKNALDGAETLRKRLEELLDLARFSRGVFTLKPVIIDTGEFLNTVALRYSPTIDKKQQRLVISLPATLPHIEADPSRLEQVIVNLLSNASKYSPVNSEITLQASEVPQGVLVEIKDQGIGIPADEVEKLFVPYHRVDQNRKGPPGIGLGLSVCKHIIEAHKGRIWIESEVGKGSNFKFILPLHQNGSGQNNSA